jgi:hypothetical protein
MAAGALNRLPPTAEATAGAVVAVAVAVAVEVSWTVLGAVAREAVPPSVIFTILPVALFSLIFLDFVPPNPDREAAADTGGDIDGDDDAARGSTEVVVELLELTALRW